MTLVGCDLHSRRQPVAVLDTATGEILEQEFAHDGEAVERFYRMLSPPVTIGIETTAQLGFGRGMADQRNPQTLHDPAAPDLTLPPVSAMCSAGRMGCGFRKLWHLISGNSGRSPGLRSLW
jgi:hypothetical protein